MVERLTVPELFAEAVRGRPDHPFLVVGARTYSYREMDQAVAAASEGLLAAGVRRGSRVALSVEDPGDFVVAWLAALRVGAATASMNPGATDGELAGVLRRVAPTALVSDEARTDRLSTLLRQGGLAATVSTVARLSHEGPAGGGVGVARPDDMVALLPTSGTTGAPKLVMQTHRAFVFAGRGFPYWLGLTPQDRLLTALPLYHTHAQAYTLLGAISMGATAIVVPKFSARRFWAEVSEFDATQVSTVGAMLEILMRQPPSRLERQHQVRITYTAPAPTPARQREIEQRFETRVVSGYGLSECPYGMIWRLDGATAPGSMGSLRQDPLLGVVNHARIVDPDGRDVYDGDVGELILKNPAVMAGYFGDPVATSAVLREGWLHTGDLVRRDKDDNYWYVGRTRDLIRRRGQNIAAGEVENVIAAYEAVTECAVSGVPSELGEEDVKAFVVLKDGDHAVGELWSWCRTHLAAYKIPRYFEVVDTLPRSATTKIAKHRLPKALTGREWDAETEVREGLLPQVGETPIHEG